MKIALGYLTFWVCLNVLGVFLDMLNMGRPGHKPAWAVVVYAIIVTLGCVSVFKLWRS